ncbi:MAG: Snf7 family protein [Candidatus Bathyarchaeia archaeon]
MFRERKSIFGKVKEAISPTPLRKRLALSIHRLNVQVKRLEGTLRRMEGKDRELRNKCVQAQMQKDFARATMYANECAEIRKIAKILLTSQIALERTSIRLETIQEFGDFLYHMTPVIGVVSIMRDQLEGIVPEISRELAWVNESLEEIVLEAGGVLEGTTPSGEPTEDAKKILEEAALLADQKLREKFPELPSLGSGEGARGRTA